MFDEYFRYAAESVFESRLWCDQLDWLRCTNTKMRNITQKNKISNSADPAGLPDPAPLCIDILGEGVKNFQNVIFLKVLFKIHFMTLTWP